jgi:phage N-6-adenine-methyltransferase
MANNFNTNTKNNDEWLTPPELIKALGDFDLDPCSPIIRPWDTAKKHYTIEDNGLIQDWKGRVWLNPPYGRETFKWIDKLAKHGNGIALIFARTETIGFHEQIWEKADAIFFFKGRIKFHYVTGEQGSTANAPSCLVAFGKNNIEAIQQSNLQGKLIIL